jgi:hypothetical protein
MQPTPTLDRLPLWRVLLLRTLAIWVRAHRRL